MSINNAPPLANVDNGAEAIEGDTSQVSSNPTHTNVSTSNAVNTTSELPPFLGQTHQ